MSKGILYTNYFKRNDLSKGVVVAVCKSIPTWFNKEEINYWFKTLAPNDDLFNRHLNGKVSEKDFRKEYLTQISKDQSEIKEIMRMLNEGLDVTILCHEAPWKKLKENKQFCHRQILRDAFLSNFYVSAELNDTTLDSLTLKQLGDFVNRDRNEFVTTKLEFDEVMKILDIMKINTYQYLDADEVVVEYDLPEFNIMIAGSRTFDDYNLLKRVCMLELSKRRIYKQTHNINIICGDANGADYLGELFGKEFGFTTKHFPALWDDLTTKPCVVKINRYGNKYNVLAGMNRNKEMVGVSNLVVLFHDGYSKGTMDDIKLCKEQDKDMVYIKF